MKRKVILVAAVLLAALLIYALLPKTSMINVQTTAYEYAMDQKEPLAEHEISIGGQFTRRLFREDVFRGPMVVAGYPETDGASIYIQFWKDHSFGVITYQQGGVPVWETELNQMYVNKDFSEFVIQLFEVNQEDGDWVQRSWNAESGRVLTTAPNFASMTILCEKLGLGIMAEGE